jgi:hypothetical protein
MDIQTLKVYISEQDLQELAAHLQPPDSPVKNVKVRVAPEGVHVSGEAPTPMMTLSFESVWRPAVEEGRLTATLDSLKAGGFPATPFRSLLLGMLKEAVKEPFIQVRDDAVVVDVQNLIRRQDLPVRVSFALQAVRCVEGGVFVEAGSAAPTKPVV